MSVIRKFPIDEEERLNAITNVINTEYKSITTLHLDDRAVEGKEIRARIRETVGKDTYLPRSSCFDKYCSLTLSPIGGVAKTELLGNNKVGHSLTLEGKQYGVPISAFAINWAYMNNKSLSSILGSTSSSGKSRSPITRIKILGCLEKNKNLRISEVEKAIEITSRFNGRHFPTLKSLGFVHYEGVFSKPNKYFLKELPETSENLKDTAASLKVIDSLKKGSKRVYDIVKATNLDQGRVSNILGSLYEIGIIGNTYEKKSCGLYCKVQITDAGKRFLEEVIYPIIDALSGGVYLERMMKTYEKMFSNIKLYRKITGTTCNLYRNVSPRLNPSPGNKINVLKYIKSNPGKAPRDIAKALGVEKVYTPLMELKRAGVIKSKGKGRSTSYHPVN